VTPVGSRGRKGRATDEAFREAARVVFAREGYLNAKISDIAAEAGRSVASFYNYYDTKADLLIALAEEFHAEATQMAILPYRSGLSREDALREAVAGFWRTYAKRRGELIGIFQAAMLEGEFRDRWLTMRAEAITRITAEIRRAQADGYCPGVDPVLTASALSAMLEHFCYIWLGQGGERLGRSGEQLGPGGERLGEGGERLDRSDEQPGPGGERLGEGGGQLGPDGEQPGQGGGRAEVPFDDERALDALATIWVKAVYWRPAAP
jgi:AcrR family transcriptional regulator